MLPDTSTPVGTHPAVELVYLRFDRTLEHLEALVPEQIYLDGLPVDSPFVPPLALRELGNLVYRGHAVNVVQKVLALGNHVEHLLHGVGVLDAVLEALPVEPSAAPPRPVGSIGSPPSPLVGIVCSAQDEKRERGGRRSGVSSRAPRRGVPAPGRAPNGADAPPQRRPCPAPQHHRHFCSSLAKSAPGRSQKVPPRRWDGCDGCGMLQFCVYSCSQTTRDKSQTVRLLSFSGWFLEKSLNRKGTLLKRPI